MSYARFGEDSAVYVYFSNSGSFVCMDCLLLGGEKDMRCKTALVMARHLRQHQEAGHKVPESAITRLLSVSKEEGEK